MPPIDRIREFLKFWEDALRVDTKPEPKDTSEYWDSWLRKLGHHRERWLLEFRGVSLEVQNAILDLLEEAHEKAIRSPLLPLLVRLLRTPPFSAWKAIPIRLGGLDCSVFCPGLHGEAGTWNHEDDLVRVCAIRIEDEEAKSSFDFNCKVYGILPPIVDNVRLVLAEYLDNHWNSLVLLAKSNWRTFNHKGKATIPWRLVALDFLPFVLFCGSAAIWFLGNRRPEELPRLAGYYLLMLAGLLFSAAVFCCLAWWRASKAAKSWAKRLRGSRLGICFLPSQNKVSGESFCLSFAFSALMAISRDADSGHHGWQRGMWEDIVRGMYARKDSSCATGGLLMLEREFAYGCLVIVSAVGGFPEKTGVALDAEKQWFHAPKQPGAVLPKRESESINEFWRVQRPKICDPRDVCASVGPRAGASTTSGTVKQPKKPKGAARKARKWPLKLSRSFSLSDALLNFAGMRRRFWGIRLLGLIVSVVLGCWVAHDCILLSHAVQVAHTDISVSEPALNPGGQEEQRGAEVGAFIVLSGNVVAGDRCVATLVIRQSQGPEVGRSKGTLTIKVGPPLSKVHQTLL